MSSRLCFWARVLPDSSLHLFPSATVRHTKRRQPVLSGDARHRRPWRQRRACSSTGDDPPIKQRDISGEFSKRITEDFAIALGSAYTFLSPTVPTVPGANGWQNLDTTFKYCLFKSPEHEFVFSAGLAIEWAGTGSAKVGAEPFNHYVPNIYFGKGFGDLPTSSHGSGRSRSPDRSAIRVRSGTSPPLSASIPIALTSDTEFHPRVLKWGRTISAPPREVTLWFTQKLEPAFSSIRVTNAAGERIDTGKARVSGNQISISLRPGGTGIYRVNWHVLSVDTHTTDGNFTFQVGQ